MSKYTVAEQYALYLNKMGLIERTMHPEQRKQVKEAFYGGFTQLLFLQIGDMAGLSSEESIKILENIHKELDTFWKEKLNNHFAKNN